MWKKVFFYFSKIFIYTCQLWKIFVLQEKSCLQFCQNSISMVEGFVVIFCILCIFKELFVKSLCFLHSLYFQSIFCQKSVFFAFFVFSKNFLSKVCVDCCRLCEELALASSAAKGDNHQLEATSRNSITSITLLMPIVEIVSLCFMPIVEILSNDTNSIQYHTPQVLILCRVAGVVRTAFAEKFGHG